MPPIPIPKSPSSSLTESTDTFLFAPLRRVLQLTPSPISQALPRPRFARALDSILSAIYPSASLDHPNPLHRRQSIVVVPVRYNTNGAKPSTVIAAVLGSVGGLLLLLWLLYTCFTFINPNSRIIEEETVVRRSSRHASHHSPRSPRSVSRVRSVRSEVQETTRVRSSTPPPRRESRRETVIVEETTRPRSPTPPPRRESRRETVIVEETRRPVEREEDIVEVFEEHSPSPPPRRSRSGRVSGYRNVDPGEFGGGSRPLRPVR